MSEGMYYSKWIKVKNEKYTFLVPLNIAFYRKLKIFYCSTLILITLYNSITWDFARKSRLNRQQISNDGFSAIHMNEKFCVKDNF